MVDYIEDHELFGEPKGATTPGTGVIRVSPVSGASASVSTQPVAQPAPEYAVDRVNFAPRFGTSAYEGASQVSRELAGWMPSMRMADSDNESAKPILDARARDQMRNNPLVMGSSLLRKNRTIGPELRLTAKPMSRVLFGKEDDVWEEEFSAEVEDLWLLYAEGMDNWADASRRMSMTEMCRLASDIHLIRGEVLASVEWLRSEEFRRPCHTALQMLDLSRLSTPPEFKDDESVRDGIKRDQYGRVLGFFIRMAHPNDWYSRDRNTWKYVEATKPWGRTQVIHIFEANREDQTRGVAQIVSTLKDLRTTRRFKDIVLQNAVINAMYAASIESDLPSEAIFAKLGGGYGDDTTAVLNNFIGGYLSMLSEFMSGAQNLKLDGAMIPHLPPGSKLQLRGAGNGGPLGTGFETSLIRGIATGLGEDYNALANDWSNVNYSSGKMGMATVEMHSRALKATTTDTFATYGYRCWLEEMITRNQITSMPRNAPSWYERQCADAYSRCNWIGGGRPQVDELKETQAAFLRIKYGLSTLEKECHRLGEDYRLILKQRARELRLMQKLGIPVDDGNSDMENALNGEREVSDASA